MGTRHESWTMQIIRIIRLRLADFASPGGRITSTKAGVHGHHSRAARSGAAAHQFGHFRDVEGRLAPAQT
jgi:hypothetical protein